MSEFLTKPEANDYFASKSQFKKRIDSLPVRSVAKVYPGRKFVLFEKLGTNIKVHACLKANVISMDRDGLCVLMKDVETNRHYRVGYIPVQIPASDGRAVFLAIPSRCTVERTLRRSSRRPGEIMESTAIGLLIKQEDNPMESIVDGALLFLPYEEFKQKTGRRISGLEE